MESTPSSHRTVSTSITDSSTSSDSSATVGRSTVAQNLQFLLVGFRFIQKVIVIAASSYVQCVYPTDKNLETQI